MSTTQPVVSVLPYRSDDHLDSQLAAIGYAAARGWPDQRPITKDLVASRLAPPADAGDTVLATVSVADRLVGWGTVRPAPPGGTARPWGPVIQPDGQRQGLGRQLLDALTTTTAFIECRDRLTTAEIPSRRTAARGFFSDAGWRTCAQATLLHARPIPRPPAPSGTSLTVDVATGTTAPALAGDIAHIYRATNRHHSNGVADATSNVGRPTAGGDPTTSWSPATRSAT